ncbi:MAG: hypothetical protein FJ290_00175 [Planctomycetes bacterium]|nr:hypothetical protein [Planctomycetota bacterium]
MMLVTLACATRAATPRRPAVVFAGSDGGHCGHEVAGRLVQEGFALRAEHSGLGDRPLAWDSLRNYNVVVLAGLGRANADMSLGRTRQTVDCLNRFLAAGGGVLVLGSFGQMATDKPPQDAFLKPLGLTPLFDELPDDPKAAIVATAWKLPFAPASAIADSPVTTGVKSLWYPIPRMRVGAQNHTVPFTVDSSWQVLVRGSESSLTHKGALQESRPNQPGTYPSAVPFVAARTAGKGRIVFLGITPEYLIGANAMSTLEGIVLDRGLKGIASNGYVLLANALRWLAEPSLTEGQLGGAATEESLLANPHKARLGKPYAWPAEPSFPAVEPALPGVVGPRTLYSSGKATADQWVEKAKAAGLAWIVFLEDFPKLSADNFLKLRADCARLSSPAFAAIPGIAIDDEVGNHYFYFGTTFPYPDRKFLSEDGKAFRSRDAELDARKPYIPGQLAMTTLDYAYSISSFKLTAGNYLFRQSAAPFADFFSNYDAMGVITARDGKVVEDASGDFLKLVASGQGPLPLVIDLMNDPAQLGSSGWRTVLRLPERGGSVIGGTLRPESRVRDYFDLWHFYPDNPAKPQVTSGPHIETWSYVGPRDYEGNTPGDFAWQNYRWILCGHASSPVGLEEVAVYDGTRLFRRFLPQGQAEFEFRLDLAHDRQHNLVLTATDTAGGRAISGEQWDRNHRLEEFMCSDRNNQLSYGYVVNRDGIGILLGGNQTLGTPIKRIASGISPAGTFKNDRLLGAPAFDGAAGGEPEVWETVSPISPARPVLAPNVTEARRLLHTRDIMIGDGPREHAFADGVPVHNVWHTLWRTQPVKELSVNRRNHFFQVDPDSPLAVFLWQIEIAMKEDMANQGFTIATMQSRESSTWVLRRDAVTIETGQWDAGKPEPGRRLTVQFGPAAYAAFLDSPLGGAAIFPLTEGLAADAELARHGRLDITLQAAAAPQKRGESRQVQLLLVGIPRRCTLTESWPPHRDVVESFYRDFALDCGKGGYTLRLDQGTLLSQRYVLTVDGKASACFSGQLDGKLVSSLPIAVCSLNDRWSAFLYDRSLKQARPVGVFEGRAWATVCLSGHADLFLGHPILAGNPELFIQLTQCGDDAWTLELHNPTDAAIATHVRANPRFDPLNGKALFDGAVTVPAGASVVQRVRR